jgi:hypothetical protein
VLNGTPMPSVTYADLLSGIALGTVTLGQTVNLQFDVLITSPPPSGSTFNNFGNISFQYVIGMETFQSMNASNVVMIALITPFFIPGPENDVVNGSIKKCKLLSTKYALTATWGPNTLPSILGYQILKNGKVVATLPPEGPYEFEACLNSKKDANDYSLVVLYPFGFASTPVPITIQ